METRKVESGLLGSKVAQQSQLHVPQSTEWQGHV